MIEDFLKARQDKGLLRVLVPNSSRREGKVIFNGREYIDFSSNDYLGLSGHPKLKAAAKAAIDKFGTSNSASRLLSGDSDLCHQLEDVVASFKNKEAAIVFNSGYQANLGIISALYAKGDSIFCDRLSHASIIDGIILSGARVFRFRHNDTAHLEALLKKERKKFRGALIATESVFSMDADKAPLRDLVRLKEKYNCRIFVDEAHATGVFGKNGSGLVEEEGLSAETDFIMGTFSKALGSFGAYLAASKKIIDYLVNASRSFIYSTALPAAVIASNLAALEVIKNEPERRHKLLDTADFLRAALKRKGLIARGDSQIVPVIMGENSKAIAAANYLKDKGYWVMPLRPPTVPAGEARLRFSLNFYHNRETLEELTNELASARV